jgi:hypothetical protein
MKKQNFFQFGMPHLYAFGAGLAGGVLFSLARQGTIPALLISNLAALPIMIATLSFGAYAGFGAAILAALTVIGLALGQFPHEIWLANLPRISISGLAFIVSLGLPAWGLSLVASLNVEFWKTAYGPLANGPLANGALPNAPTAKGVGGTFVSVSSILALAALFSAAFVTVGTIWITLQHGSFNAAITSATERLTPLTAQLAGHELEIPDGIDLPELTRLLVLTTAPLIAAYLFFMFMLNLWLAARAVQISGRLTRPWPDIPRSLRAPRIFAVFFLVAILGCFIGGLASVIAASFAAAIGAAFALQGLAVVHDLSRGQSYRTPMLFAIYTLLAVLMTWPLPIFTLIGLAEAIFLLRDRKAAATSKP